jgi:hypothetical protein
MDSLIMLGRLGDDQSDVQESVRSSMSDEVEDISKTLLQLGQTVMQSDPNTLQRIADAYWQARVMVADIPNDKGNARPRIVACFARSDACRFNGDLAFVGWMLTAIEERINERDLRNWRSLRKVIKIVVNVLSSVKPTIH